MVVAVFGSYHQKRDLVTGAKIVRTNNGHFPRRKAAQGPTQRTQKRLSADFSGPKNVIGDQSATSDDATEVLPPPIRATSSRAALLLQADSTDVDSVETEVLSPLSREPEGLPMNTTGAGSRVTVTSDEATEVLPVAGFRAADSGDDESTRVATTWRDEQNQHDSDTTVLPMSWQPEADLEVLEDEAVTLVTTPYTQRAPHEVDEESTVPLVSHQVRPSNQVPASNQAVASDQAAAPQVAPRPTQPNTSTAGSKSVSHRPRWIDRVIIGPSIVLLALVMYALVASRGEVSAIRDFWKSIWAILVG